jgi:drug/metabolite transporter (DMT)-like permease
VTASVSAFSAFGVAAALVSAIAYGFNAPYAALAAQQGVGATDLVLWRVVLMVIVVGFAALLLRTPMRPPAGSWPWLLGMGATTAAVGLLYLSAVAFIPVGVAVVVFYTFPLVILVVSPIVDGGRPTPLRLAVFAEAFAGIIIAIGPSFGGLDPVGLLFAALASLGAATQFFVASRITKRMPQVALLVWVHLMVLPVAIATALAVGGPVPVAAVAAAPAVAVTTLGYVIAFLAMLVALKRVTPALAGLVFTLEPVVAIVTAAVVLGERLATHHFVGAAFVLVALVAAIAVERRETVKAV